MRKRELTQSERSTFKTLRRMMPTNKYGPFDSVGITKEDQAVSNSFLGI